MYHGDTAASGRRNRRQQKQDGEELYDDGYHDEGFTTSDAPNEDDPDDHYLDADIATIHSNLSATSNRFHQRQSSGEGGNFPDQEWRRLQRACCLYKSLGSFNSSTFTLLNL